MFGAATDNFVTMETREFWGLTFDRLLAFNWYLAIKIRLLYCLLELVSEINMADITRIYADIG